MFTNNIKIIYVAKKQKKTFFKLFNCAHNIYSHYNKCYNLKKRNENEKDYLAITITVSSYCICRG